MDELDASDWIVFAIFLFAFGAAAFQQLRGRLRAGGLLEVRDVRRFDRHGGILVSVAIDARGVKHVSLAFDINNEVSAAALITPEQAGKLARMLEVAASPGRNVAQARWNHKRGVGVPEPPREGGA